MIVVDEEGNEYEATYPKRARGLVKNGRARFVSETKICLARPPNNILEDETMNSNFNFNDTEMNEEIRRILQENPNADVSEIIREKLARDAAENAAKEEIPQGDVKEEATPSGDGRFTENLAESAKKFATKAAQFADKQLKYADKQFKNITQKPPHQSKPTGLPLVWIMQSMDKIIGDTSHIQDAMAQMALDTNSGTAAVIGDIVKCRETTNQQTLRLLEKMYDDLKSKTE